MLNKYLEDNYNKIKDIAYNIAGDYEKEDLFSFVIEELYKCDQEKLNEIIIQKKMTFYILRIMVNQFHSKTSRYYYKYKKYYEYHTNTTIEQITEDKSENHIYAKNLIEDRLEWVKQKLKDCYWFDAEVFKIYYLKEHSLNSLSKETGINRNTLFKAISNVRKFLKNEQRIRNVIEN